MLNGKVSGSQHHQILVPASLGSMCLGEAYLTSPTHCGFQCYLPLEREANPRFLAIDNRQLTSLQLSISRLVSLSRFGLVTRDYCLDSLRLRFFVSQHRKNSVRDKVMGKKLIYLERNTIHRIWAILEGKRGLVLFSDAYKYLKGWDQEMGSTSL